MSKIKKKQRSAANTTESATLSVNEKILHESFQLYTDEEKGLIVLGEKVGLTLLAPRKKITVLLIGNHSAGKSSFINWYIEEHVQRTSVAIETQGFTLITSGKKRESLTGMTTLHVFPHIRDLEHIEGVVDYLDTQVSTSKQKKFNLVTFIDSPGLVDGDMNYPFDVNEAIIMLGNTVDLIFVLFDPLGQALCKRTLNILEELSKQNSGKLKLFLSKADTAGLEKDRQRVLIQITQEICKRPGLNKAGFDMPAIFVPTLAEKSSKCENQIEELCLEIENTINRSIQNTLNTLERDAQLIVNKINEKQQHDSAQNRANLSSKCRGVVLYLLAIFLFLSFCIPFAHKVSVGSLQLDAYLDVFFLLWNASSDSYHTAITLGYLLFSLLLFFIGGRWFRTALTLSRSQKKELEAQVEYVNDIVKGRKAQMYKDYLQQSVELT
ncbi:uncharacterized protein LOC135339954 [Halichondria panicea]|uniref:uncharacterized protein LOC135339954 n=1 Tax=Halichondria panicea TaxID=6063 RepID=UPI00312B30E9